MAKNIWDPLKKERLPTYPLTFQRRLARKWDRALFDVRKGKDSRIEEHSKSRLEQEDKSNSTATEVSSDARSIIRS